ncbi:hypothetical protein CEP88_08035 [Roseobacter denitrificans]|nr:PA14 domain-containing protein [Roseobacter denitrificans]AVL52546.1 hypothetical protein CEP88_08035 [Roseobacter denitrificans]SFG29758.1 PA14 domain-containing protein [Roseobacter denitrificans OCh 114]
MVDDDYADGSQGAPQSDAEDLKKKVAEQSLKSAGQVYEDPARGSLHYGKDEDPETANEAFLDGAAPLIPQQGGAEDTIASQSELGTGPTPDLPANAAGPGASEFSYTEGALSLTDAAPHSSANRSARAGENLDIPQVTSAQSPAAVIDQEEGMVAQMGQRQLPAGGQMSAETTQSQGSEDAAPEAVHLSNAAIAENVEGAVLGRLSVSDADVGDVHRFSVSDDRFEILEGVVKLKEGESLSMDDAASLTLEITAVDSAGGTVTEQFSVNVVDMPEVSLDAGFHARYFDVDQTLRKLDDIDWSAEPTHRELVEHIDYTNGRGSFWEGGATDTFGAQISGNIEVEEGGTFNFFMGGDDGVVLYVNGIEVIEDDGLHSYRTRSGEIDLEPGTHVIEIRYFENYGHAGLKLEWEGPGIEGRELVTTPPVDDLQTVTGMPLSVRLDIEQGYENTSHTIKGLPDGSIVQLGDQLVEVGETGSIDISGKDVSVVQITPPVDFTGDVSAILKTTVTLEGGGVATSQTPMGFKVNALDMYTPELDVQTGFKATYFDVDHSLSALDQIDWSGTPTHEEVVGEIDYENGAGSFWEGGPKDTFGARITGDVTVEEGGVYNFYLGGDDGVVLYVNGEEVVEDDGLHSFRTRAGEIELEPGTHEIEIRYFENHGVAGLKLEWDGPGTNGRELVQADSDLTAEQNGAIDIRLDTSGFMSHGPATLSGLPADTILVSGDMTAVADGNDVVLEGWNLDLIEVMPPPGFLGDINVDVSVPSYALNGSEQEVSTSFQISVVTDEQSLERNGGQEDLVLLEQSDDSEQTSGWSADATDGGRDSSSGDDDILDEAVASGQGAEQTFEVAETYERQDW